MSTIYNKWLHLNRRYPKATLTPTVEIDQEWHEHMKVPGYLFDCVKSIGFVPVHDTSPTKEDQANGFCLLQLLWRKEFNETLVGSMAPCSKRYE